MPFPIEFITRTRTLLGGEFDQLLAALEMDASTSIRVNPLKGNDLVPEGGEFVPWCANGYYLSGRLPFTFDPLFHAGVYYVQEASSMFLEQAIQTYVTRPVRCLDLCAAPGGKTTHLASLLPEGSLLVCNEVIRSRSAILAENVTKWGYPNTVVLNNDPAEIGQTLSGIFEVIVADLPCSGEGMFRKDVGSAQEWSMDNVRLCASRQRRIIHDIWPALKPGGFLVYSTCTYNTEEDEENVHYLIEEFGAEPLAIPVQEDWRITGALRYDAPVYRFFPHKTRGEGFFLALLRKPEGRERSVRLKSGRKEKGKKALPIPKEAFDFLSRANDFSFAWDGNFLRAYLKSFMGEYGGLDRSPLRVLSSGICLGEMKGKDFIPSQDLALSVCLNPDAFLVVDLAWEDAIKYLRKESFALPEGTEKGYVLLRYQGFPLGFAKHLGNRMNNLYPAEWRIRSSYLPEERPRILIDSKFK